MIHLLNQYIEKGQSGLNRALPMGIHDPNNAVIGVLPSHYYLIGADSGVGKTTFADYHFLIPPYFNPVDDIEVDWFYYSLELPLPMKMLSWLNYIIYINENETLPLTDIAGFTGKKLSQRQLDLIDKYTPVVEKLIDDINIHADSINPTGIHAELFEFAKKNGTFVYEEYEVGTEKKQRITGYLPDNPNKRVIVIIDHLALLSSERGKNKKELMDKMSEYAIWFRNICGFTFVMVQQFNTSLESNSRSNNRNSQRITPSKVDFGDSTYTYRDADVVIGGVCPAKFEIATYRGYNITEYKESLTFWFLIKNRWIGRNFVYPLERIRDVPILTFPDDTDS